MVTKPFGRSRPAPAFSQSNTTIALLRSAFTTRQKCCQNALKYRPQTHLRSNVQMVSTPTLVFEFSIAAIAASSAYFIIQNTPADKPSSETPETPPQDEGVLGLSDTGQKRTSLSTKPAAEADSIATETPSFLQIDTVGVNINDYLDESDNPLQLAAAARLEEELKWASASILDVEGCETVVVVDSAGDIIWVEGDLVSDVADLGVLPPRVGKSNRAEVVDVMGNDKVPFLTEEVRSIAVLPVGIQGATMIIASREQGFFETIVKRNAEAVCSRLASFVTVPPT